MRAWLEQLDPNNIQSWADLRSTFIEYFHGTYTRPTNSWDLCNCRQRSDETLHEYTQHMSKMCNKLHNIMDAHVISAFPCRTTYEVLVHTLERDALWAMRQ